MDVFQQRTLIRTRFVGVLDDRVQTERDAGRIHSDGVPAAALLDIGAASPRPIGP
ncbi:hypothetical protein ACFVVU_09100 [Kitasatospora sp. NPDC057965]|uniref:hypothetical protein n=1 Tax=Kitasatospora sp. NPDC057965 TaxID=3346291 RepID=UPI0036D852A8